MNQSIIKALRLLDFFSEDTPELSLKEITSKANLPKPTVYRLLSSLEYCGFLSRTQDSVYDSRYKLGLKLMELGELVSEQLELRKSALPHMKQLSDKINEAVHLVILNQYEAIYIEKVESNRALRLHTRVGKTSPLHQGSGPKLLLAYLPKEEQFRLLKKPPLSHLEKSEQDMLLVQLKEICEKGFAISCGEQDAGTVGISYPVYDFYENVIAALAVSGPANRFEGAPLEYIKQVAAMSALAISRELGYRAEPSALYE